MTLKNLIVLTDNSSGCAARIETALVMAGKFDAYLTAVYAQSTAYLPDQVLVELPDDFRETARARIMEAADEVAQRTAQIFHDQVEQAGRADKSAWRLIRGNPNYVAAVVARYADLVVAGQSPSKAAESQFVDPGEVVSTSGRPMFIVPQEFKPKGYTGHALLGWNGSREAARAISDAMMILGPESKVTVAFMGPKSSMPESYGFDIGEHLQRHGVAVEQVELERKGNDSGKDLINYAGKVDADLIVMGAYTHSRLREEVFGGATRTVLRNMTTPIFLSH
ncbi:MAG: universal stress protein [Desulfobacteraceae bacterium]|jgi:nucleotide-binding universal stress UspA family protein